MADATQHIAGSHGLARLDRNRAGRQMGERRKYVATAHDHVIAEDRRQTCRGECHGVPYDEHQLAQRMDPASLGDAIGGAHDLAIDWCVNLGPQA